MATAQPTASFHVLAASVLPCGEGRKLLVRTSEFPASALIFPAEIARAIGEQFRESPRAISSVLTEKAVENRVLERTSPQTIAAYEKVIAALGEKPAHGAVARTCREHGVSPDAFWAWRSYQRRKQKGAAS